MILLVIFLFTCILYEIQNKIYLKYWNKGLSVEIKLSPKEVIEGNNAKLIEIITKEHILPIPSLNVKFKTSKYFDFDNQQNSIITDNYYRNDIFSIMGNKKITRTLDFIATKRGYYTLDSIDLIAKNIFLSKDYVHVIDNINSYLYVYPKTIPQREIHIPLDNIIGDYIAKRCLNEDPFDFRGIRDYQPYDNFSSINWNASAKSNNVMVNQYNFTTSLEAEIIFNADLLNSQTSNFGEIGIRIVATIAQKICKSNIPFKFSTNAYDIITNNTIKIPTSTGPNQLKLINESLAKIDLSANTDNFISLLESDTKKGPLKIIVSADYSDGVINAYKNLLAKNKNVIFILPTYYDNNKISLQDGNDIFVWEVKDID